MSGHYPPLTYKDIARGLRVLGFSPRPQKATSHEHWVKYEGGRLYKVTVDKPKSPFSHILIASMAKQAGVSKKELYRACSKKKGK